MGLLWEQLGNRNTAILEASIVLYSIAVFFGLPDRFMWGLSGRSMCWSGAAPPRLVDDVERGRAHSKRDGRLKPQSSKTWAVALAWLCFIHLISPVEGVTCNTCKDTISGCSGGSDCPLLKTPGSNAQVLADASSTDPLSFANVLPAELLCTFTRTVMETLVAVARAPKAGGSVDLTESAMAKSTDVVRAAINGFCTYEDAGLELAARLEAASDDAAVSKISAALTLLKSTSDKAGNAAQAAVQSGMGLYTFIWAKAGAHLDALKAGTVRILAKSAGSASSMDLTAKVRRPKSEEEFHYMLFLFMRVVVALGFSFFLLHDFVGKVVFTTMHVLREDFKVAHELLLVYFREIETSSGALHFGNVHDRGSADTLMAEARANAATFFRSGGGTPLLTLKWNGKFDSSAKKPCVAFNFKKDHKADVLAPDGSCRFNHVCMQWVSDKGPRGTCGGSHCKMDCTYDPAQRRDSPLP